MAAHTSKLSTTTVLREACSDLRGTWRPMVGAMLVYTAVAAAVLVPMTELLLRVLIAGRHGAAVADVDIARFFFTSITGVLALLLLAGLSIAILSVEQACLMSIALAFAHGRVPRV